MVQSLQSSQIRTANPIFRVGRSAIVYSSVNIPTMGIDIASTYFCFPSDIDIQVGEAFPRLPGGSETSITSSSFPLTTVIFYHAGNRRKVQLIMRNPLGSPADPTIQDIADNYVRSGGKFWTIMPCGFGEITGGGFEIRIPGRFLSEYGRDIEMAYLHWRQAISI